MTLLTPIGLVGLLGVVALIIIYIIKPNFQQKFISSTYIWKLSLKYRKKKIPTSKLRNLLLILCQVLFLTICAFLLAKPNTIIKAMVDETEVIAIIDSSASMRTEFENQTRFERAVDGVQKLTDGVFKENGIVSVIIAEQKSEFLVQRVRVEERHLLEDKLLPLTEEDACSYGASNVDGALTLCEEVLKENPSAKIYLYTDMGYGAIPAGIEVIDVTEEEEWNAGILDASAKLDNNYYTFTVDVAYYCDEMHDSVDKSTFSISLNITNANPNQDGMGVTTRIDHTVNCTRGVEKRVIFITENNYNEIAETVEEANDENTEYVILTDSTQWIYSYEAVYIILDTQDDSFNQDNEFNIFNGQKDVIRIQYSSGNEKPYLANPFIRGLLFAMQKALSSQLDIRITEVKTGVQPATEGFDFYLFEHSMPEEMPEDGVVMMINPDKSPLGSGFRIEEEKSLTGYGIELTGEMDHPLLQFVNPDNITVSRYKAVTLDGTGEGDYDVLVTCDTSPVVMVKNEPTSKVVVLNFSVHYSNIPILKDFPIFMYNMFQYFFPATTDKFAFEVYEEVVLNARGEDLKVEYGSESIANLTEFPIELPLDRPGNYTITQTVGMGNREKEFKERIFVKVSSEESNIWKKDQTMESPYTVKEESEFYKDWLPYLAGALVALLFLEWWLQSRDSM